MNPEQLYGNRTINWSARRAAAVSLAAVINGQSLATVMPSHEVRVEENDRGFYRDLVLGSCRHYFRLNALAKILMKHPFGEEDTDLTALLIIGLYQLAIQNKAPHAAVHATVDCAHELGKQYAKPVINACLRRYGREYETLIPPLDVNPVTSTSHPKWLVKMLKKAWPQEWASILDENNHRPPLCLRVNRRFSSRDAYLLRCQSVGLAVEKAPFSDDGLYWLEPSDVTALPGFADGHVSVQDEAAQLACQILEPKDHERILDACSAPGGKTAHILEHCDCSLTAVELEASRAERITENLSRLQLSANIVIGDMLHPEEWWDGEYYDRILLDVPCSATGVIRRHPDIKLLRRNSDIEQLRNTQAEILKKAWDMLKPGGTLVYATCSVLPLENHDQIVSFVDSEPTASSKEIHGAFGSQLKYGRQLFPKQNSHDGFFYARLHKTE